MARKDFEEYKKNNEPNRYHGGAGIKPSERAKTASQRLEEKARLVEAQKRQREEQADEKRVQTAERAKANFTPSDEAMEALYGAATQAQSYGTPYSNRFGGLRGDADMWMAPIKQYAAGEEVERLEAEKADMYAKPEDYFWVEPMTGTERREQGFDYTNRFDYGAEMAKEGAVFDQQIADAKAKQNEVTANYYATLPRRPDFISGSARGAAIDNGYKTSKIEGTVTNWEFFTDEEKAVYNYLLGTEGEEAAEKFWQYMQEPAQQRLGNIYADRINNIDSGIGRFAAKGAFALGAGVENAMAGLMQATTEEELPTSGTQYGYQKVGEDIKGLGKIGYDLTFTMGNMLPSMLFSGGLGAAGVPAKAAQLAGSTAMGLSAGGNAYKQGLDMGMTTQQAKAYGRLIGASEGGLQNLMGGIGKLGGMSGKIDDAVRGIKNGFLKFVAKTGGSMVSEASEEALQAVLEPLFQGIATGTPGQVDWSEVAYNALMGALMGGVFEAPQNLVETVLTEGKDAMFAPTSEKPQNIASEGVTPTDNNVPTKVGNAAEIHPDSPGLAQARERLRQSTFAAAEKSFGKEGYAAFQTQAQAMDNPADSFGEMTRAYNDGLVNRHAASYGSLSSAQYEAMFEAGRTDAAASIKSQMDKRGKVFSYKDAGIDMSDAGTKEYAASLNAKDSKALDAAAKAFGVKIRFADSVAGGDANAEIKKGIITIEKGNPNPLRFLFGHEITHRMQELAPQEYARLREAAAATGDWLDATVRKTIANYNSKGRSISREAAMDEAIADYMGAIMEGNAELERFIVRFSGERTLLQRLKDVIREIRIKLVGTEQERRLLEVEKRLDEAAKAAAKQAQSNAERTEAANVGAVSDKAVTVKVRKAVQEGKAVSPIEEVNYSLKYDSKFMADAEKANAQYKKVSPSIMKKAAETRQAIADIFNDPDLADSLGLPPDIIGNTYIPNGSYSGTEENTTVCIRSISADALMDAVAEYLGRPLTVQDTITISQELMRFTDKPECLYCYVAMDRKAHREFLGSYLKQRDDAISNIRNGMSREEAYEKFRDGRKDTKPMRDRFNMWLRNMDGEMITPEDLASYANMEKAMERNPTLKTQINDALKYAQSASWAKKRMSYSAYNGHILKWKWDRIRKLNSNYGLRMYSFSDFSPAFILENMQMITDAAVRDLKVLAYTKELDFVRIFAGSGMNINISVFGYDYEGGVAMDAMQGADWAEAQALRQQYPNVGCTFVATNDGQVNWALEQDWIDVIIPFHMVRTGSKVASYFNWKNYTAMSADTKAEGWTKADAKHILPPVHQNDKAKYLEACRKNHLTPRFNDWVDHPNYMKLVNETRRSERETNAVQPIFDLDAAKASIEDMRKRGGYYTPIGGTEENMRDIAAEIGDSIEGRFSLKDSDTLARDIVRIQQDGIKNKRSDAEIQADIRAAVQEVYQSMVDTFGAIDPGENAYREVQVPSRTAKKKKVSKTVRTVMEAQATPDEAMPKMEELVATGEFSYEVYGDKAALKDAREYIQEKGWAGSLAEWLNDIRKGNVSKRNTAVGWLLYDNAVNSGDVETAMTILNAMVEHQRSAAQAVQATRLLKKLSPETQLYGVQRSVVSLQREINDRHGKKGKTELKVDEELAKRFLEAQSEKDRDEAMKEIYRDIGRQMPSTFIDKFRAWRYLAMLGNPRTHSRNIAGNAAFAPVVLAKDITASAIEAAVYRVSGGKSGRSKTLSIKQGVMKAAWQDYKNVADMVRGEGKYSDYANANRYIEEGRQIFKFAPLEKARRGNTKALETEDMWFSQPHYAFALAQYCSINGISAEQIRSGKGLDKAREYAAKEAQKATYRDTNQFSQAISHMGFKTVNGNMVKKGVNAALEGVLPFRKTPANILVRGLEYSPLGLVNGIKQAVWDVQKGNMTASEAIDNISAGLTGTGLLAFGVYLAAQGLIRGRGSDDENEKEFEELMGHQSYALETPDGKSYTLDWLAPEALPFFIGVNLYEQVTAKRESQEAMQFKDVMAAVWNVTEPMLSMSCLQSLNDLFEAVGYASSNDMNGLMTVLSTAATSYLSQALPTIAGQIERIGETERMTTYTEKNSPFSNDMQYFFGRVSGKTPGEFQQIPYIDAWGRTESTGGFGERAFNNLLNPAYSSHVEMSAMEEMLLRLYNDTGEASVLPSRASKFFNVDKVRKDLTAEEYVKYATEKGQLSYNLLTGMMVSEAYMGLSNADQVDAVEKVYDYADAIAKTGVSNYKLDGWVAKANKAIAETNVKPEIYIPLYIVQGNIEGLKDSDGKTISNSKSLQVMQLVYATPGLTDKQRKALFEAFGVSEGIRHYNKALVEQKLREMQRKAK